MVGTRWGARCVYALALLACVRPAAAQPDLTTIEDTVYRADGQRFSGIVYVEWQSFLAANSTSVGAFSKTVQVVDGILRVSLVPTTNASAGAYYRVRYTSGGRVQFIEYWAVPPSTTAIKLKDARLIGPPVGGASVIQPAQTGAVTVADVIGLSDELLVRPKKGLTYTPSRAAVVNGNGELVAPNGDPTHCVHVDGSAGPCGDAAAVPGFVDLETPVGTVNGTNLVFTLTVVPDPLASLQLYRNGLLLRPTTDYTLSGNVVTFVAGAAPQSGDVLSARYRVLGGGVQSGLQAGGALTGFYPSPSIASGAIANQHIAAGAAIAESKLALNFPTHTSANDPTSDQKAALAGTSGTASTTNRYVTNADPRMTDSRNPTAHALLGGSHFDANPGTVARGDIVVGQGSSPTLWGRLPLGPASRCLTSNGFDAVWNTCLFTGFPSGAVPFVDGSGNLTHSVNLLFWDGTNRRLGIGTNAPAATLSVLDPASGTGKTTVQIKAGEGQGTTALQRWLTAADVEVGRLDPDGLLQSSAMVATSTTSRAAWRDTGTLTDPPSPSDGSRWANTTEGSVKSREGGQTHVQPQIICSTGGSGTSSTTETVLGQCRVPASLVRNGDRFDVRWHLSHEGAGVGFSYSLYWAGTVVLSRSGVAADVAAPGRVEGAPQSGSLFWSGQSWGNSTSLQSTAGALTGLPSGEVLIEVRGNMASSTSETLTLRQLSVVRVPAQSNP